MTTRFPSFRSLILSPEQFQLKLSSTVKKWYRIMGHGGHLDIDSTVVRIYLTSVGAMTAPMHDKDLLHVVIGCRPVCACIRNAHGNVITS